MSRLQPPDGWARGRRRSSGAASSKPKPVFAESSDGAAPQAAAAPAQMRSHLLSSTSIGVVAPRRAPRIRRPGDGHLLVRLVGGGVADAPEQVGVRRLLEGGFERLDKLVGQPAAPARPCRSAGPNVRPAGRARARSGRGLRRACPPTSTPASVSAFRQGRFAHVGVADDRNGRDPVLFAAGAQQRPAASPARRAGPAARRSAAGCAGGRFRAGFRPGRACRCRRPAGRATCPSPREPRQPVAQLRQLDLQFALGGDARAGQRCRGSRVVRSMTGTPHASSMFAHLRRRELAVEDDEVRAVPLRRIPRSPQAARLPITVAGSKPGRFWSTLAAVSAPAVTASSSSSSRETCASYSPVSAATSTARCFVYPHLFSTIRLLPSSFVRGFHAPLRRAAIFFPDSLH